MSDKFQHKYRIPSARLQNWDYGCNAIYFVTICTAHRECFLGEIGAVFTVETQNLASLLQQRQQQPFPNMKLSEIGNIAQQCWMNIPVHFPFVELGEFVVMPNHVHGIIIVNKPMNWETNGEMNWETNDGTNVETQDFASLQPQPQPQFQFQFQFQFQHAPTPGNHNQFGPQSKNLASIIRGFKIGVTKYARSNAIDFGWQSRYYDHIIRNDESFQRVSNYITNNPLKWMDDKFYNKL
jgi:putative transposase